MAKKKAKTTKRKVESKEIVIAFRVTKKEFQHMEEEAKKFAGGQISLYCRGILNHVRLKEADSNIPHHYSISGDIIFPPDWL